MPTIKQLPLATSVQATDVLPVSQGGTTRGLTIGNLLSSTQAALSLVSGTLLGRVSGTAGGPEPVALGSGLGLVAGSVVATGSDHLTLPVATALAADAEVVVNSSGGPRRLAAALLRGLFTAGSGVSIDASGLISAAGGAPATASALGSVRVGAGLAVSGTGTLSADGSVVALRSALSPVATSGAYADLAGRPQLGRAAGFDVGVVTGTVADGGVVAGNSATLAAAITIGGAPIVGPQSIALATAAGSSQGDAPLAAAAVTILATVAAGAGVVLPPQPRTVIVNRGQNALKVYPPAGGAIELQGANTAVQVPAGAAATFVSADNINFYAI